MENAVRYFCRGRDKEELTEKVQRAIANESTVVSIFQMIGVQHYIDAVISSLPFFGRKTTADDRIVVTCSHGHKNVFVIHRSSSTSVL